MIVISVCLPSDALSQSLPSYLGFLYLRQGVSLHGCPSKAQPLLLTLDEGCLLVAAAPDLGRGVLPLGRSCVALLPILDQEEVKIPLITPPCLPCVTFAVPLKGDHCYLGADPAWLGAVSRAEVN